MSLLFNFEEIGIHEQVANADYEYLLMMKKPAYAGFFMSVFRNYLDTKNHSGIIKPSQKTD